MPRTSTSSTTCSSTRKSASRTFAYFRPARRRGPGERQAPPVPRAGIPHELLGPHGPPESRGPLPPARLHSLPAHRVRQPLAEQRCDLGPRARAGRAGRLRSHRGLPDRPAERKGSLVRTAGDRRPRQGGLPRGDGILRPPHHGGDLVSPPEPRLPPAGGRGHRRDGELRILARPHRPRARVPRDGRRAHAEGARRCAEVRPHVRQQRPAARPRDRRTEAGRRPRARWPTSRARRPACAVCRGPPGTRAERPRRQVVQARR